MIPVHSPRLRCDDRLHCCIEDLSYDFRTRTGEIRFPGFQCCDMTGCIELFRSIHPEVRLIQTFDDYGASTRYVLVADGWIAQRPLRRAGT